MSKAKKGKKRSVETREKISKAQTGKKHSAETREKMSKTLSIGLGVGWWCGRPGLGSRSISCCAQINVLYILSTCVQILVSHWSSSLR